MKNKILYFFSYIINTGFALATEYLPSPLMIFIDYIVYFKKKINPIKPIPKEFCINIEGITEANIDYNWWVQDKPLGISGICRVKNGDDFLEEVIESHLILCDEVIIGDNLSTDRTKEISLKLQEKYPGRVKYFEYPYEVFPVKSKEIHKQVSNSIHSLAYQNNWTFAKSKYKYVMKLDDDNLIIPDRGKKLRNLILKNQKNRFYYIWGINLILNNGTIGVPKVFPYLGKYGDHGIFPVTNKTYFHQFGGVENIYHPYLYYRFGELFLHLKYLKKDYGMTNLKGESKLVEIDKFKNSEIDLNVRKYSKYFKSIDEITNLLNELKIKNKAN